MRVFALKLSAEGILCMHNTASIVTMQEAPSTHFFLDSPKKDLISTSAYTGPYDLLMLIRVLCFAKRCNRLFLIARLNKVNEI